VRTMRPSRIRLPELACHLVVRLLGKPSIAGELALLPCTQVAATPPAFRRSGSTCVPKGPPPLSVEPLERIILRSDTIAIHIIECEQTLLEK